MPTLKNVIKKIRETLSELKKSLLGIVVEAGRSDQAAPEIRVYADKGSTKKAPDLKSTIGPGCVLYFSSKDQSDELCKGFNEQQNTNESLTIPKELALAIINDAKKLHEEVSEYIRKLYYLKQLLISIKDLETIASRDIEIGTKYNIRAAIKFLDELKAEWRSTAPPDKITGRISISFNVKKNKPVRLSISLESARLLVETLVPYLRRTQPFISPGIPSSDVLPSTP